MQTHGVIYWDGMAVGCNEALYISRRGRKYATIRRLYGRMEFAGNGVAWVGSGPTIIDVRVPLNKIPKDLRDAFGSTLDGMEAGA